MNLLFIDCEVANKCDALPKICQFGYVLLNENFEIISKNNFYINPGENEDFSNIENRKIDLDYKDDNYAFYRKQNTFPYYYEDIISLLTNEDTIILGWSVSNDLFYLVGEIKLRGYIKEIFK